MIDTGALNVGGLRTSSGGGGGGGGVSASWVDENYISKAFFNQLFTIHSTTVTQDDPQGTVIEPNDTETAIASIQALVGLWTEKYVSALGLNSGGGGGGGVTLYEPLVSINQMNSTPSNGQTLIYQNNQWTYGSISGGGVTSITAGAGLTTGGSPITTSGTIAINSTYQTYISHGESAYNALSNYLLKTAGVTAIVVGTGTNANKIGVTINGSNTGFITVPFATNATNADEAAKAVQLKTTRKIWGQDFNGTADVKGTISNASGLEFTNLTSGAGHGGFIDFHYEGDTSDYTSRIIEDASGKLKINNTIWAALSGNVGIGTSAVSGSIKLVVDGYTKTSRLYLTDSVYLEYNSQNSGVHLVGAGFYSDSYISALGSNSGGGGGGGAYIPISGSADIAGSLTPGTTNAYDLGTSSKRWKNIYCNSLSVYSNISGTSMSLQSISVSTAAIISSGAKFASICIESNSSGAYDASRSGEINRYAGILHLQYNTANGITLCQGGGNVEFGTRGSSGHLFSFNKNKLVIGDVYLYQSSDDIVFDGTDAEGGVIKGINGMTITTGSDIRMKDVKNDAVCDVETIAKAPVFNFEWKANKKRQHLGTSAQYWQTVFANAIYEDGDGHLSMDYGATALAAAVMTARRVVELEKEIAELKSKLQQS